jgi:nucleotide-binding universal stress UspA family protein
VEVRLNRILVPFDGSEPARAALAHARVLAARSGATVTLAYVVPAPDLLADLGVGRSASRDAAGILAEAAKTIVTPTRTVLLEGDPATALAAEADRLDVDLVILGSRGRSPLVGLVLGSTARKLLLTASRPVMVVHAPVDALRTVVAGVDTGESAAKVARAARALAEATGAAVTLVNVLDADRAVADRPEQFGIPAQVWKDAVAAHAERVFAPLRPLVPGAGEELRYGNATAELREAVDAHRAEVVVVARKGRSGLDVDAWFGVAFTLAVRGPFATLVV